MTPDEIDDWLGSVYTRTVNCDFREQQEVIDVLNYGTTWKRYYVNNDEIKVERIDPRSVLAHEHANVSWNSPPRFIDPPPPYVRHREPQTYLTPVAAAVKIALDGSVN